jgi:phage terminase small subunit
MTPKQAAFVDEYLIDLNATQAAIRAGYSAKTAGSYGNENLQKPEIQQAIGERMKNAASAPKSRKTACLPTSS